MSLRPAWRTLCPQGPSHPHPHPHPSWGTALWPVLGSCLGVGAVGEVGDGNPIGKDLPGGGGHSQDGHPPQLQGGPLAAHVHHVVHEGVLGSRTGGCEQTAAGAPGQASARPREGRGHSAQPGPVARALGGLAVWGLSGWPPGDRWPSRDPGPAPSPQAGPTLHPAGQGQDSRSRPGRRAVCRPRAPAPLGSPRHPRRDPRGPPRSGSGPRPAPWAACGTPWS